MRFNQELHPEYVLNKRGDKFIRGLYQEMMDNVVFDQVNPEEVYTKNIGELVKDDSFIQHIVSCKMFKQYGSKVYCIQKDFGQDLSNIDREIPIDHLSEQFMGYFYLPPGTIDDDDGDVEGAYVYIGKMKNYPLKVRGVDNPEMKILAVSMHNRRMTTQSFGYVLGHYFTELTEDKVGAMGGNNGFKGVDYRYIEGKVTEIGIEPEAHKKRNAVYRLFVNAVLYLHSQDAFIDHLRPTADLSQTKKKQIEAQKGKVNECTVPVTLINWNYGQERTYSVGLTQVKSHLRWQRCGENFTQIKLIWVKTHERHYKNVEAHAQ